MSARFEDRVVIVTGAASGIGEATARRFASEGARVVLADIDQERLDAVVAELVDAGADAVGRQVDVSNEEQVTALVAFAVDHYGRLDVLVNNAGASQLGHVTEITAEQWHHVMAVNVDSVFFGAKAAIPHLVATSGCIVNTCSISGLFADYGVVAYTTAKGAVANLTRNLAIDHAPDGVRVNAVNPGGVATPMAAAAIRRAEGEWERRTPLGKLARPEDIAAAIAFLASDDASHITGHNLVVDGGLTAATGQPNFRELFGTRR